MQLARLIAISLGVCMVTFAGGLVYSPDGQLQARSASSAVLDFPAWRLLPTSHYATLTDRLVGSKRWVLFVYRARSQGVKQRVCLQAINVSSRRGSSEVSTLSGRPECSSLATEGSFAASQIEVSGRPAIGVVAANPKVTSVEVELVPGGVSRQATKTLNEHQMRKSNLPPLVYSTLVGNAGCLERISGLDDAGSTIFSTGSRGCSDPVK
jgi:hypothetical protein